MGAGKCFSGIVILLELPAAGCCRKKQVPRLRSEWRQITWTDTRS